MRYFFVVLSFLVLSACAAGSAKKPVWQLQVESIGRQWRDVSPPVDTREPELREFRLGAVAGICRY